MTLAQGRIDLAAIHPPADKLARRREIAQLLLNMAEEEVEAAHAGWLGADYRQVSGGALRTFPRPDEDAPFAAAILERFKDDDVRPSTLLAAMLYFFPYELPTLPAVEAVPPWLTQAYFSYTINSPLFFWTAADAERHRLFWERWVRYLHDVLVKGQPDAALETISYSYLSHANVVQLYFNDANIREPQRLHTEIAEATLARMGAALDITFAPPRPGNRIRLGILFNRLEPGTEPFATLPLYRHLDRKRFEIALISPPLIGHPFEDFCLAQADRHIELSNDLTASVAKVRAADLDMLFAGANISSIISVPALLAMHRVARVQIASACAPVTTGARNVDYYISGTLAEPRDAQAHYTEDLRMIDGASLCFDFGHESDAQPARPLAGEEFGIPPGSIVFVSGANVFKISPELEKAWAHILAASPQSLLMLYPLNPNWNGYQQDAFILRLRTTLDRHGIDNSRVILLGPVEHRGDVLERLRLCDIYLDSFPYSGATSLLDPLQVGLPIVARDGTSYRTLGAASLLRSIGMDHLIAPDADAYVKLALELAGSGGKRKQVRRDIQARMKKGAPFFDGPTYSRKVSAILEDIWRDYLQSGNARRS